VGPENQEMCGSGQVEGSYVVDWKDDIRIRINLICTGPESLIATLRGMDGVDIFYSLLFSAIDGDYYSFTSYGTGRNDAGYIGTNTLALILKLKLSDLKTGYLSGTFVGANGWERVAIKGSRTTAFMPLPVANPDAKYLLRDGLYVPLDPQTPVKLIDIEIVGGIQRILAKFDIGNALKMLNGADAALLTDGFYATSSYSRGETGRTAIAHMRGHMVAEDLIEFYYINMELGLLGPFLARRTE
jgi:hypothetical protein